MDSVVPVDSNPVLSAMMTDIFFPFSLSLAVISILYCLHRV